MLSELIEKLKSKVYQEASLGTLCYYFIKGRRSDISSLDKSQFTGEVEHVTVSSFSEEYADISELVVITRKLNNSLYRKHLNIFHFLGLSIQDQFNSTTTFDQYIQNYFENHSIKYKYLITKVFEKFEDNLKKYLTTQIDTKNHFTLVLRHIYLQTDLNLNLSIRHFEQNCEGLDMIDLLLLEDLSNLQQIGYDRLQQKLLKDILWCATEIQSKHRIQNNSEDQYNSLFQSLLAAKDYIVLDQTQRGSSSSNTQYGELDIAIFTKEKIPLSILEAFIVDSLNADYITKHLKKLSENYDPNGLKNNYAVTYAKSKSFLQLWERYKTFIPTIDFEHTIESMVDVTNSFPQFAGIRLGLSRHKNRGVTVQIYHVFMDMEL